MKYFSEWNNSWSDLFKNLKLLIPDIVFIIFEVLLAGLILWLSGLFPIVKTIYLDKDFSVIQNSLVKVIVSGLIFVMTSFVFGAGIRAIKYNYITDVIRKKKVDLKKFFGYSKRDFLKIIYVRILLFLIAIVIFGVVGLLGLISKYFFVLVPLVVFVYGLGILFVYPIMFLKGKGVVDSVKLSFDYFRDNIFHVLFVWLIMTLTGVAITSVIKFVNQVFIVVPLNLIIGLFLGIWSLLYLFKLL